MDCLNLPLVFAGLSSLEYLGVIGVGLEFDVEITLRVANRFGRTGVMHL